MNPHQDGKSSSHDDANWSASLSKPLRGKLILDCSALLPGPLLGKMLLNQGARVIKIENPHQADGAQKISSAYQDLNENKEIIALDLKSPAKDRKTFEKWVAQADGLIEGFRPKAKIALGLDEATLHKLNPKLCILSLTGYPESSPMRDTPGHDLNFAALTGAASLYHEMPALPLADLFSAYSGAYQMACALLAVSEGGQGRRISVSMTETLLQAQSTIIREYQDTGVEPMPGQTLFSGKYPCYRLYYDKDGKKIAVGAIEPKFWQKVCEILNLPELATRGYDEGPLGEQVISQVQRAFSLRKWKDWAPHFIKAECCVDPVLSYQEVFSRGI